MGSLFATKYYLFEVNENHTRAIQQKYAHEIEDLENIVYNQLVQLKKQEIFFTTGYDDVLSYIKDKDVTIVACEDNNNKLISSAYVTQGQGLYTYNDLSKYFKFNKEFIEYAKSKYDPKELYAIEYETFMKKIEGYKYAKQLIAKELNVTDIVGHCKSEKEKGTFDEKNKVREKVNRYIYDYFRDNKKDRIGFTELDRFYLIKFSDLQNCEDEIIKAKCANETEENKKLYEEYGELIDLFDLNASILPDEKDYTYLKPDGFKKYFDANPFNTIELDTYMVHPDYRKKGLAKITTFEGLKIQMRRLLRKRPNLSHIFLSATIHQDNYPSKRVTLSFGKFDTVYIKRRTGINREVYFYKIERKDLNQFMRINEEKINETKDSVYDKNDIVFKNIEL